MISPQTCASGWQDRGALPPTAKIDDFRRSPPEYFYKDEAQGQLPEAMAVPAACPEDQAHWKL